jgi:PHD/YefM family antitoxin component YafN of YafNO toxin-antitoxin module
MIDAIVVSKYEIDLEQILDDVSVSKKHYFIENEDETVAVIPADEYVILHEIYEEWIQTRAPYLTEDPIHPIEEE